MRLGAVTADIAWDQIQGARQSQQDAARCLSWPGEAHLLVLADGMGGHVGGEIASGTVVETFCDAFIRKPGLVARERLLNALQQSNYALYDRIQACPQLSGMGATILAAMVERGLLNWVSVGDSPLWLVRDGEIRRLNEDHSVGAILDRQAAAGRVSVEEAARALDRSSLREAVMGEHIALVDAPRAPLELLAGDLVLAASDGVQTCSNDELCETAWSRRESSAKVVDSILGVVEERSKPSQDNATLIVLRLHRDRGGS